MGWRKMRIHFQSFTQLFQRLVNPARHEQPASEGIVDRQGQRVKVPGTLGLGDPLLKSPYIHQITAVPVVSRGLTGVEFQSALVFPLGRCPIPLMSLDDECERCVRFGESVIHCDGFQRRCLRSRQGVFRRKTAAKPKQRVGVRQAAIRSEEHTSELQSRLHLVCRLLLEKKKTSTRQILSKRRPRSCSKSLDGLCSCY